MSTEGDRGAGRPPEAPTARSDRVWALSLLAGSLLVLGAGAFFGLPSSKGVVGALRVLRGEVPYRDFWSMYAPGQFYAIAGLYRLFGAELMVQGLAVCLVRAASTALLFALLRRAGAPRPAALAAALVLLGLSWEIAPELTSYPPALLLGLAALFALQSHARTGSRLQVLLAGLALGVAATFKHDVAAYLALAAAAGVLLGPRLARTRPPAAPIRSALWLALGALIVVVPVAAVLARVAGAEAWRDLIVFPATDFRHIRAEPWPPILPPLAPWRSWLAAPADLALARAAIDSLGRGLCAHLPEAAWCGGLALAWRARGRLAPSAAATAATALVGIPLYEWAAHTQPNTHVISMAVLSWLLGAALLPRTRAGLALAVVFLSAWAVGFLPRPAESAARLALGWRGRVALRLPGARAIRVSPREAAYFQPIVAWIQANVPPEEPIYCGVTRHDLPVIGNLRFYVLSGHLPAHRTHEIHPGITDDEHRQRETIARLDERGVRCAVLWRFGGSNPDWSPARLERRRALRQALHPEWGSDLLDRWLAQHFEPVMEVDEYVLLKRRQ